VYLPAEDLDRFGVLPEHEPVGVERRAGGALGRSAAAELREALARAAAGSPEAPVGGGEQRERLAALVRFECERAGEWFDRGITLAGMLDRRSAACVLAMAGIYRRLLERIEAHPEEIASRRVSLPAHEKAWVAVRGMLGVGG